MEVLERFRGILCHDHWKPYFKLNCVPCPLQCSSSARTGMGRRAGWSNVGHRRCRSFLLEIHGAVIKAGGSVGEQSASDFAAVIAIPDPG